jgi:putative ABC transport system permease protein
MATPARETLLLCWAAMALVLAVTCTNVAGLLLARTETRSRELSIRASLGASRGRLARQLMIESLVLALSGAVAGLVLASWSGPLLIQLIPEASLMSRLDEAGLNPSVLGFTILLACVTCGLFGLAPAWRGCSADLRAGLTENARTATESRTGVRLRGGVQVVQLALTVVLLAGAGLMVRSISHLYRVPLGFDADRLLTVRSQLVRGEPFSRDLGVRPAGNAPGQMMHQWALTERALRFPEAAIRRVTQVPGVESAAMAVMGLPMYRTFWYDFAVDGKPMPAPGQPSPIAGEFWAVTPSYFATMGIGVVAGRALRGSDTVGRPRVAVINHYMARKVWPQEANVVGRRVATDNDAGYEIVGVVRDVRVWPLEERSNQVYVALAQHVQPYYEDFPASFRLGFDLIVRTSGDPRALGPAVTDALARAEPAAPIDDVLPYSSVVSATFGPWRSTLWLFALNGALALALSAIGLYGMVSFSVTQRTREIGIRVALGASGAAVVRLMVGRALGLAALGLCFGMIAAFWGNRLVANRLYGVTANDPVTLVGVAMVLLGVAAVATWLPARRAARVDPADTLRVE